MSDQPHIFEYGQCRTHGKDDYSDYQWPYIFTGKQKIYERLFEKLGLPFPEKSQILHGTHHGIVFIESHKLVLRLGKTDIADLVNPTILQPLGWVEEGDIKIAIYPGIEHISGEMHASEHMASLRKAMQKTSQKQGDFYEKNVGIIRIKGKNNHLISVPVIYDADENYNGSSTNNIKLNKKIAFKRGRAMAHGQDLISHTMTSVYGMQPGLEDWFAAFETHQPLRTLFWYACLESRDGSPNPERLKKFWERAHQIAQAPEHIKLHQVRKDFSIRSKPIDVETTTVIDTLALYKPWTSEPIDRVPEFTGKQKRWTDALKDIAMEKEISVPRTISIRQKFMAAAIKVNPKAISHCHPKLADNPNFMMKAYKLSDKTAFLQALSPRLKTDKKFLTSLLDEYGYNEEFYTGLPTSVLQDYDMAAEILAIWPSFYEHLPNDMQISKDFANYLITNGRMTARALSHSCDVIKADQKLWRDAIRVEPLLLKFCQNGIEKDHHYILDVAQTKPEVLAHAKYFCRDKDFIIEAAKISSDIGPAIHGELLKDRKFLKELLMIDMDFRNYIDWDIREDPSFWEDVIRFPNCDYLDIHQGVRLREDFMRKALKIHPEWVNEELFAMDFDSKFLTEMYSKYPPKQPPPKKRFMCV